MQTAVGNVWIVADDAAQADVIVSALSHSFTSCTYDFDSAEWDTLDAFGLPDLLVLRWTATNEAAALLDSLRSRFDLATLPIIVILDADDPAGVLAACQAGASTCILRPYDPASLLAQVRAHIATRLRIRELVDEVERSEQRFRTLADVAPDIISRFDHDLRHLYVGKAIERITGIPVQRYIGASNADLGHPPELVELWNAAMRRAFEQRETQTVEFPFAGPEGVSHHELYVAPVFGPDGEVESLVTISRDVTERVRTVQALEEAARQKDQFIAVLGHELRNPVAAIRTATDLLGTLGGTDPLLQRVATVLDRQTTHIARLLDDLLEVSRIARGKTTVERRTIDLGDVVRDVVEDHRARLASSGRSDAWAVQVELPDEPVWVDGDPVRLAQVTDNLLSNAIKYTVGSASIRVRLSVADERVILRVRDNGIGIDPEFRQRIFEPFEQAPHGIARSSGGLGLGLAITKGLVELHEGTIDVHSDGRGQGSEFVVELPISSAHGHALPRLALAAVC